MDSTEFNKIAGAVLAAFLLLLLLNFTAGKIYGTGEGHHHDETLAFAVEVDTGDGPAPDPGEPTDYLALLAGADAAEGEKLFKKCKACHKLEDGANGVGPSLYGVVGRDIGGVGDYSYSSAMADFPGDWTLEQLGEFLLKPADYVAGTKMVFKGFKDPQDRVNLIVYLNEADGSPEALE